MTQATHSFKGSRSDLSTAQQSVHNIEFSLMGANYMLNKNPDYFVYLYSVSEQSFSVSRPPLIREFKIIGKPKGSNDRYVLATKFPQPLLVPKGNVDSNEIDIVPLDTRRFATDILNPDNLTIDQDAFLDPKQITSQGNNLGAKGVFWSLNGPGASVHAGRFEKPTEEEVDKAYERMEKYYRAILEQADTVEASDPGSLSKFLGPEHHTAAEYFGEDRKWHNKKSRTDFCVNCGERIKAGAAFHKTEEGTLCIIDWNKTVRAGVRTNEQAFAATKDPRFAPSGPPAAPVAPVVPKVSPKQETPSVETEG